MYSNISQFLKHSLWMSNFWAVWLDHLFMVSGRLWRPDCSLYLLSSSLTAFCESMTFFRFWWCSMLWLAFLCGAVIWWVVLIRFNVLVGVSVLFFLGFNKVFVRKVIVFLTLSRSIFHIGLSFSSSVLIAIFLAFPSIISELLWVSVFFFTTTQAIVRVIWAEPLLYDWCCQTTLSLQCQLVAIHAQLHFPDLYSWLC